MNKKIKIFISIAIVIFVVGVIFLLNKIKSSEFIAPRKTEGLTIVPTMQDEITADSTWTGTFQLVWNDLVNEVVKNDVVFNPQEIMVANLNKQEFTTDMITEDYYYKKYGLKTRELKKEIEEAIKEKFNQKSDILDDFDWSEEALDNPDNSNVNRYFFYVMLYRKFEYLKEFNKLEKADFGEYKDIEYFGLDNSSTNEQREQIEVLYYNSDDDFAILINTKTEDEVIFYKNPNGNTFKEIYDNMNIEVNKYKESKKNVAIDKFKAPNLKFNELKEYDELANKPFLTAKGEEGQIAKAIQTIQFYLDEKGGEVKSEAGIDMKATSSAPNQSRNFYIDDTFAIFLREKGKSMPYFASRIDDITKFQ